MRSPPASCPSIWPSCDGRRSCTSRTPDRSETVLIAATALTRSLIVVTRNISDFQPLAVDLLNRWDE